jgi:2-iminobutanoate/2-iminopropanoate deaminase
MLKKPVESPIGKAIGPYSLGIDTGDTVFLSGQIPLDGGTGKLVEGGIEAQTEQVFKNIKALLDSAGLTYANVVKATVFMTDLKEFAAMNAIYEKHVAKPYPARSTIQVAGLPMGARVEIECIAKRG